LGWKTIDFRVGFCYSTDQVDRIGAQFGVFGTCLSS
jgi:hypothetical protein